MVLQLMIGCQENNCNTVVLPNGFMVRFVVLKSKLEINYVSTFLYSPVICVTRL